MHCSYCNEPVEPQFTFCEACGKPLNAAPASQNAVLDGARCKCGSNRFDSDGYCEACGLKPSPLDAIELVEIGSRAASASHRGRHHAENQDAVAMLELPDGLAIALADGVSTSCHAKVAADLAVQTALQSLQNTIAMPGAERIACAIQRAHEAVCALPHDNVQLAEPQATLVLALVSGERLWYGWIGDSRLYVSDQHTATQLTIDDSWLNEQLSAGVPVDTAQKDANAHCIVQCLGMRDDQIDIHVGAQILPVNATVLVCSDGLWNYCDEPNTLWALCEQHQQAGTPVQQCIKLVDFANAAGGQDNITVALYRQTLRS